MVVVGMPAAPASLLQLDFEKMGHLFSSQNEAVEHLVKRLAVGAKEAVGRKEGLQEEIMHNLHEQTKEAHEEHENNYVDDPDQTYPQGGEEGEMAGDDHWEKTTEVWHNKTVAVFFERLEEWLHPPRTQEEEGGEGENGTAHHDEQHKKHNDHGPPSPTYTETSELFLALKKAREEVDEDVGKWRDAQKLIHEKESEIKAMGLGPYNDADEPEDDGYQGR